MPELFGSPDREMASVGGILTTCILEGVKRASSAVRQDLAGERIECWGGRPLHVAWELGLWRENVQEMPPAVLVLNSERRVLAVPDVAECVVM